MPVIQKPCPVSTTRMKQVDNNAFFCNTCQLHVHDLRNKADEELQALKGQKICGIFNTEQLSHEAKFSWYKGLLFKALTLASFLGFTVHPVQADTFIAKAQTSVSKQKETKKNFKPKKKKRKKKQATRTQGTPRWI